MSFFNKKLLFFLLIGASFLYFPQNSQAAECRLINILTDKSQVELGESMQVNVIAQKECIGKTASIKICSSTECSDIASQTFGSRIVSGQAAINPVVINIIPSDFFDENTNVFVQATVPFNTVKSRTISLSVTDAGTGGGALFGEFCIDQSQCVEGLICSSNACVECTSAGNQCTTGQTCRDGTCVTGDASGTGDNGGPPDDALRTFPGEDLEAGDVINIVVGLSCWLTRVAFTLTVIFVIWAGFQFMAAQGNPTKYQAAVKNFQNVLWGVLVIYGVYVIIATVAHAVGVTDFSFIPLVC